MSLSEHEFSARSDRRAEQVSAALARMHNAFSEDFFVPALAAFREAAVLSRGLSGLERNVSIAAIEEADHLVSPRWRIAETLLDEAAELVPGFADSVELRERIAHEQREMTVSNALADVDAFLQAGDLPQARESLAISLKKYPGERRLSSILQSCDMIIAKRAEDERQLGAVRRSLAAEPDLKKRDMILTAAGQELPSNASLSEQLDLVEGVPQQAAAEPESQGAMREVEPPAPALPPGEPARPHRIRIALSPAENRALKILVPSTIALLVSGLIFLSLR